MRSVVITGASTGIGWATAKMLLDRGFRVFGSVRQQADEAHRADLERAEFEKKLERDARYTARKERKKKKLSVAERWGR